MFWRKHHWGAGTAMPAVVFLLGLCIAAFAGLWLQRVIDAQADVEFQHSVDRVSDEITRRFRQPIYGLKGAGGLYAANRQLKRAQFRAYVESRDLPREFPGVQGFGFIQRVMRSDLDAFITAERADDSPEFVIRPLDDKNSASANVHDDLYVIKFIEPLGRNFSAYGLDIGSERLRREGAERAIDSGEPTLSAAFTLVQEERRGPGFLLFVPVFRHGVDPSTSAQRRRALVGLLCAPMFAADLLGSLSEVETERLNFELFDRADGVGSNKPASQLVFDSLAHYARQTGNAGALRQQGRFLETRNVELPGRDLTLRVRSTPLFEAAISNSTPWLVFAAGLLVSAMFALLMRQQVSGRHRAEVLARNMTIDLDRLAQVAKHTSNAVLITDRELRITWVNEGFTLLFSRIIGYVPGANAPAVLGKTLDELLRLSCGRVESAMLKTLAGAIARGTSCRVEISHRAEDNREHWLDLELQPLLDARGQLTGFMQIASDITERKRAEVELRTLSRAMEQSPASIVITNRAGEITYVNPRFEQVTGYTRTEAIGKNPRILQSGATSAEVYRQLWAAISAGGEWHGEVCNRRKNGELFWEFAAISGVRGESGEVEHFIAVKEDITARRKAEEEVRRHGEVLHSVLENLPCGLSVFNAELHLVAANAKFRRMLDLPDTLFAQEPTRFEDIIRFNAERGEYGVENIDATVKDIVERARAPTVPHQFERMRPNGTPLEIRGGPMPTGGFVTTYTDISARHQAEAEVKRSTQLLRGAIDAIDEAFVLFDPDDRLVFCNDKYRQIFGSAAGLIVPGMSFEAVLRTLVEHGQRPASDRSADEWVAERMAEHGTADTTVVQRLNDGRSLRIVERKMPDGHIAGFRIDITELVRATEAAEEAKAAAEAATAAKSQFLANMSHEIRTPMNAILGMLALLRKTELTTRQADYAGKTEGAARALLGLLNDILDFSKVEAGKMTLDPHPFRIDQLLRDLSVILSANIGSKNLEVLFDIDPALPRDLVGDAMRLQQVLINLSGNAIKFTAKGEVVVSLKVTHQDAAAATFEISVRDTGIGIAPENQARIFSGFTQAEASTTRRYGGSGLGVAISQRLVVLMGGELKLDSALGQGSRFHFCITLPVAPGATGEAGAVANNTMAGAASIAMPLRALVVDDNPTACDVLERMGQSLGWTIDVANSGKRALEILQSRTAEGTAYQVVFVDWQMPGMDGWETSRRIRELGLNGTAPVVVMVTAYGREMLSQRSEDEQTLLDGFLVKPVTASMLFDAVVDARADHSQPHLSRPGATATGQRLAGMRLLVAEDNLNNQQVARELLEDEGAIVQIANHGQEAVDAVAAAEPPFDVVLMDLQMPVMDGFTATSRIRQDLGLQALPIIAMTANAMSSDREACLSAGMNDHVGKPFDLNHLVRVLRRHAGWQDAPDAAKSEPEQLALPAGVAEAATAAGVDIAAALKRIDGNLDLYRRMLRIFVKDLAGMPAQLSAYVAQGEMESALRLLHTLKGLSATLGADALSAEGAHGEKQLAANRAPAEAATTAQRSCTAITTAVPALDALLAALKAAEAPITLPTPTSFDADAVLTALREMTGQLRNADMAATDAMTELQRRFGGTLGAQLQPMDDAIGTLDFDHALRLCEELINKLTEGQPA